MGIWRKIIAVFLLPVHGLAMDCNPVFRAEADRAVTALQSVCHSVSGLEPSVCQRALTDRCAQSLSGARRSRESVCQNLRTEAQYVEDQQHGASVDSQRGAQESNTALNYDAFTVSESIAALLAQEAKAMETLMQGNRALLASEACAKSTAQGLYAQANQRINTPLQLMKTTLERFRAKKKSEAESASQVAEASKNRATELDSLRTPVANSASSGSSGVAPVAAFAGVAGAGLLAASLLGGKGPSIEGIAPAKGGSNMDSFKGNADEHLDKYGLKVDSSFRDQEKRQIAQAVQYIPECHRKHLKGLRIQNNPRLTWQSARYRGQCLPGKNSAAGVIQLNPTCYNGSISTALVVHEMIHVVANATGMYARYAPTFHAHPRCPVSDYAKSNFSIGEDFTEAARLAVYPGSGGQLSNACSEPKVSAARGIMACR